MFEGYFHSGAASIRQRQQDLAIIVLSMTGRVLHANRTACGLACLSWSDSGEVAGDSRALSVPPLLQEFARRVSIELEKRIAADEWTHFELKQIMRAADRVYLLRGFGLPDILRRQQSRILVVLQPIADQSPA
ncbi:MAG TPA: PAS domain-containing protein [Nitrospiraceae bacterium]|nr:PAS domain-containing protein [Nitrospiraceae bacterium]